MKRGRVLSFIVMYGHEAITNVRSWPIPDIQSLNSEHTLMNVSSRPKASFKMPFLARNNVQALRRKFTSIRWRAAGCSTLALAGQIYCGGVKSILRCSMPTAVGKDTGLILFMTVSVESH